MPDSHTDPRATPPGPPSDELVLAAVERAARHRDKASPAVPIWAVLEHLHLARRSAAARHVRSRLDALCAGGWVERSRRHGVPTWQLTPSGRGRLEAVAGAAGMPVLPESPQHRAWRNARTLAAQEIERFRGHMQDQLDAAALLLDADPPAGSDAWFELAEGLRSACRTLASASYCLHEWDEPDDAAADLDDGLDPGDEQLEPTARRHRRALRAGRRNVALWRDARVR